MKSLILQGLMACGLGLALSLPAAAAPPLTPQQFQQLQQVIPPDENTAKWMQIPWLTDLTQARQRAAAEGKPILLWEMDGHPLGCT